MEIVRIPVERVSALVGKDGKIKTEIESKAKVELRVHPDGEVEINGDAGEIFFAKDIVKAIGRGFDPKTALKLLKDGYNFYLINLKEQFTSDNAIKRVKGRVIGEEGKVKAEIETATESYLSIFGNTIGIISKYDTMEYAKEAVYKLLQGAPHSAVFTYLSQIRKKMMSDRLRG
jgi:ribosomal RNA assembly protein